MTTVVDRTSETAQLRPPVTVAELVAAARDQQATGVPQAPRPVAPTTSVRVDVLGAHGGAGASTVALALAQELAYKASAADDATCPAVRLVDLDVAESSGLVAAAEREIASPYAGWRAGRRGPVVIYTSDPSHPSLSGDRTTPIVDSAHTIVDVGHEWSLPDRRDGPTRIVLVCRATIPGVRRAERVLLGLDSDVLLAAVGSRRWSGEVMATFGPRTRALVEDARCVLFPPDRRLERCGPDASSLPRQVTAAAWRLADLLRLLTREGAHP